MKRTLTLIIALALSVATFAQTADDACQFSQTYYQGTAKALGMGNALGAVGGDMTSICINPAGMGIYRSNEITFSTGLLYNYQLSSYYGTDNGMGKMRLSIPNLGWVSIKQRSNYRPLRSTQFGIGLTRTNDFNIHSFAKGLNPTSSKTNNDNFLSQIYDIAPDDLPADIWPLWSTYLIDDHYINHYYYTSNVPEKEVWQSQENTFKGRSEEWSFTGSANYFDRLYIGISLNLTHLKREGKRVFEESNKQGDNTDFEYWKYSEDIASSAFGCNAKIGLIYHANNWLRMGASFHSPSVYAFNESWQPVTQSQFVIGGQHTSTSQESHYEYTFISPLKCVGSMAFIIEQRGLISLDAEFTDFGAARFKASDYNYDAVNEDIKNAYGKTLNFRLGSEWRLGSSYLRLGAAYYGSPFGFGETGGSIKKASCGISLPASESTTFDFAYELTYGQTFTHLYNPGDWDIEAITQKQFKNLLLTTLKVRF